jgi:hypothetical protein
VQAKAVAGARFRELDWLGVQRWKRPASPLKPLITFKRSSYLLDERLTEAAGRFDPARVQ